ncbi:MAG: Nucleoside 5-triphosphatase RdgB (dHAPTP, dITP, XTP-specific) [Firmicutes bacterium]|nr:Nucleoside 5-triphosphatase RdgB (dHAPTP, dITP, XTP-specific) [Bacillota bacterium]MDI6707045.1 XTP/dITP diphosphatase [Bacillota bacterium]
MVKRLVVASRNKKKIEEIKNIMEEAGYLAVSVEETGQEVDVVEDGNTFEANSLKKAFEVMKACGEVALADDSGLEVDALDGQPGVFSARFSGEGATDEKNNAKLLEMMKHIPAGERQARFVCAVTVAFPDYSYFTVRGECKGEILFEPRGKSGFGYDPLFYLPEYRKTFAELDSKTKNLISHRAEALAKAKEMLMNGKRRKTLEDRNTE